MVPDTGVEISTRILTQGGATVQGSISFICKIFLVAKFLFFQLRSFKLRKKNISGYYHDYLKLYFFGFFQFFFVKRFPH